ncbi:hypothetical protein ESY86_11995 [Subsaximicrobium wynnwilliamsii]|uniref:Uncharacterized protein n=1 Tax=Subsaximicrobium wynnwilliamsii TaxID=291179 RepID=A0A5C6ZIF1_9FLAO|nr:hypothetical protein [Subsaximicrobium wynnwilliamsii]TXD82960.1 hypothetical protein ESY87_12030 [Subsaximicrobium wynnwilliamsii]TXD88681.1 hypothetical protein ESY86_11995 [Subsaximicrobium wynnwilliamsii]TXE02774.1 hypothetical protein ESY88_11050 [Subsaximicrobium wynnwilliamsii]
MGLEIITFIAAILFGIFIYWRESNGNGAYRLVNRMVNSKKLQMKPNSKKGFIFQQAFLPRLIFLVAVFLFAAVVIEFLTPLQVLVNYQGLSLFSSAIFGTLIGTYLASFIIKSTQAVGAQSDSLEDKFDVAVDRGRDFFDDLKHKDNNAVEQAKEDIKEEPDPNKKSARERLKDKGLM